MTSPGVGVRPDVEVVGGVGGVRYQLALVEHGDDDGEEWLDP